MCLCVCMHDKDTAELQLLLLMLSSHTALLHCCSPSTRRHKCHAQLQQFPFLDSLAKVQRWQALLGVPAGKGDCTHGVPGLWAEGLRL